MLQVIGEIVACVNANFFSEEHWLIQRRHRHHGDQCEIHRKVIKDLDVFHDALAKGTELPAFELTHGLDALLLYYLVDDLFNPAGLASLARRAAHDSWRLK